MKKQHIVALLLAMCIASGFANKIVLHKNDSFVKTRKHPYSHLLSKQDLSQTKKASKDPSYQKLLVILVDFQEEDNPLTTGNGKFLLQADPDWKTTIGSPPHNREYFEANLEALKYYYRAVSMESYQLEYDVYPKDKAAYTLANTMSYYNPPNATSALFLQRMEEYFKESFETADADDPEIDFAQYGHYMIIHAGSDWQHDILGDSPSDIPSFFIRVGTGKEAVVDNGNTLISHACNVPSTISQDFDSYTDDGGDIYYSGYGALNAVIAHEFGHSLGLVDLYNVYNFQPMVGVFDIMDSGGGGILIDPITQAGPYVLVEGVLPVLPGAYSRALLFEDFFSNYGYLYTIDDISMYKDFRIQASSAKQDPYQPTCSIVKIPLNQTEYLLIENRSVDPDGDGDTAVHGTLDDRVVLYPTPYLDDSNTPSYEYDYLLPSFIKANGKSVGGGILVWHVDEDIIYNQGVTASDGEFYTNFENNTVNTNYYTRGVKIIEADALPDIGYQYSYFWTGTPYEYFHKRKPVLDNKGNFVFWSQDIWRARFDAESIPPMEDNKGIPGIYRLEILSDPAAKMNLRFGSAFFDQIQTVATGSPGAYSAPMINSSFSSSTELPIITPESISLFTHQTYPNQDNWANLFGEFPYQGMPIDQVPVVADVNSNAYKELILCHENYLKSVEFATDDIHIENISFDSNIRTAPLYLDGTLFVLTENKLYDIKGDEINFECIESIRKMAGIGNTLLLLCSQKLIIYDVRSSAVENIIELPESFGFYEPIIYSNGEASVDISFYLMSDNGNIYRFQDAKLDRIFVNPDPLNKPTQMGISRLAEDSPAIFFGCGTKVYAIKRDGTLISSFPKSFAGHHFDPYAHSKAINTNEQSLLLLPSNARGYLAVDATANISPLHSLFWTGSTENNYLHWEQSSQKLYWFMQQAANETSQINIYGSIGHISNPIFWNGFRNGNSGIFSIAFNQGDIPGTQLFEAFVFPNPVRNHQMRIRLIDPRWDTKISIYDFSGAKIFQNTYEQGSQITRDVQIDTANYAAGVYLAIVENNGKTKKIKFSIEK